MPHEVCDIPLSWSLDRSPALGISRSITYLGISSPLDSIGSGSLLRTERYLKCHNGEFTSCRPWKARVRLRFPYKKPQFHSVSRDFHVIPSKWLQIILRYVS